MVHGKTRSRNKAARRVIENSRDLTQIKKDMSQGVKKMPGENRLAEDIPGRGKFYCNACSRYFMSAHNLQEHMKTKPHKRRVKSAGKHVPYTDKDAELAAGLGTDNGVRKPKNNNDDHAMLDAL